MFSSASATENSARHRGRRGIAVSEVQVHQQTTAPAATRLEFGRDVHRRRGRAHAALGPEKREDVPARSAPGLPSDADDRRVEILG